MILSQDKKDYLCVLDWPGSWSKAKTGTDRTKTSATMLQIQAIRIGVKRSAVMHRGFPSGGERFLEKTPLADQRLPGQDGDSPVQGYRKAIECKRRHRSQICQRRDYYRETEQQLQPWVEPPVRWCIRRQHRRLRKPNSRDRREVG
jgi:hypothetical protein